MGLLCLWVGVAAGQVQVLCPGDPIPHRYWVHSTPGSRYVWVVVEGSAFIQSGQGTHEVVLIWGAGIGVGKLKVIETTASGCVGEPALMTVEFRGPRADLLGNSAVYCAVPQTAGLSIELDGVAPWSVSYMVNDKTVRVEDIGTSPYVVPLSMEPGGSYEVKLVAVSDRSCSGTVHGEPLSILIGAKVQTSAIQFE